MSAMKMSGGQVPRLWNCVQTLPQNPRTEIHELFGNSFLQSPIGGPEVVVLQAPGYGGDVIKGALAIGIARFTVTPM